MSNWALKKYATILFRVSSDLSYKGYAVMYFILVQFITSHCELVNYKFPQWVSLYHLS